MNKVMLIGNVYTASREDVMMTHAIPITTTVELGGVNNRVCE